MEKYFYTPHRHRHDTDKIPCTPNNQGMEELKDLLFCASQELERVGANAETQRQIQERRLLHLQELLTATRRERDEAREQLLKLEQSLAEYCNMITNAQQHVLMSNDQFFWNSTPAHHLDLRPDVELHRPPTSSSDVDFSNLMDLNDQPFYHQLSLVERQESEQQQQEVESHLFGSPACILWGTSAAAMPDHLPEPPVADIEVSESALPERGNLLKAVIQAGPLLQTLLITGPLPEWRNPPPVVDSVEIPRISICPSPNSTIPIGPLVHHVPNPHGPVDPLQVNSAVSCSDNSLLPCTRINRTPTAAFITSGQSGSEAAASSSKLLFAPVLNSMESSITASLPLKFAKRH